jgi:membrane associated rhomboid family serine protease
MPRFPSRYSSPSLSSFGFGPLSTAIAALIGVNVLMFLVTWIAPSLQFQLGLVPMWVVHEKRVWQLLTYMFIHAGGFHLIFNMLTLWMFGSELERIWGTRFFLKFYFITAVGSGLLTVVVALSRFPPLQALLVSNIVGASGAIFGLLFAYALYFPNRIIYYFIFPIRVRIYVIISGAIALYASMSDNGSGVANATHLGGLLIAFVYLKGARLKLNPWAEVKYRYIKWKINRVRKKFDVYSGGKNDEWNRRVH